MHSQFESVPKQLHVLDKDAFKQVRADFLELIAEEYSNQTTLIDFFAKVFLLSPYLKDCAFKEPAFVASFLEEGFEKSSVTILARTLLVGFECDSEAQLMSSVRIAKRQFALLCGIADLGGWWNGDQVTSALSDFAKASLSACLDFVLLQNHTQEKLVLSNPNIPQEDCGFIILGMGKLGAGELNYSSDIDLIFIFDDAAKITLNTDDPISLLSRMAKQLIKLMQERTGDGYVFRMDLRLRPDPSSTPLVIPLVAALNYYEGQGQNWERAAMIKARAVSGDIKAGEAFLRELSPFIWRKYLDFAAINDVQSIKRQIHAHKGHGEIAVLGHNIKLGRGGIREIEFFAQTQQLIAGGRNVQLRVNETTAALNVLYENNWIEEQALIELTQTYWFLRDLEHRLQMVDDGQTHILPDTNENLRRIAFMSGESDVEHFSKTIRSNLKTVEKYYSALFETAEDLTSDGGNLVFTGDEEDPDTLQTLQKMGFARSSEIIKIVKAWHVARIPALRTTQARELLTELVPDLLKSFSKANDPDNVVFTFDKFLSGLPAGIQLFSILKNNPDLSDLVIKILSAAPRLAAQVSQRPHVFDAMIDPQFGEGTLSKDALATILNASLNNVSNYEMALDEARRFFSQTQFMIGCQFFAGTLSTQNTAKAFSVLAEVLITSMLDLVIKEFELRHGKVLGSSICVLGMGRLGSYELTATSDLDLIFLYDFDDKAETSDGEKPLAVSLYFIRLMQRFISAMSSPTSEGKIFELDFRLRPSGNAGPLATHVDGFIKYQREEAWVWEAQSLTRARVVAGNKELSEKIMAEIPEILAIHKKRDVLEKEILDMRRRIEKEKGTKNIWNLKSVAGGLLDIEFIAQWLAIKNGSSGLTGTREILEDPRHTELLADSREKLLHGFDLYNSILQTQRICLDEPFEMKSASSGFIEIICSSMDMPDFASAEANLKLIQKDIRKIFTSLLKA